MFYDILEYVKLENIKVAKLRLIFDFYIFLVLNDRFNFTLIRIPERNYDKIKKIKLSILYK